MVLIQLLLGQHKMYLDPEQNNCGNLCIVSLGIRSVFWQKEDLQVASHKPLSHPGFFFTIRSPSPASSDCDFPCSQKYSLPLCHRWESMPFLSLLQLFWAVWYNSITTIFAPVENLISLQKKLEKQSQSTHHLFEWDYITAVVNNIPCP